MVVETIRENEIAVRCKPIGDRTYKTVKDAECFLYINNEKFARVEFGDPDNWNGKEAMETKLPSSKKVGEIVGHIELPHEFKPVIHFDWQKYI